MANPKPFVLGFAGYSGSGKTTLLTQLIRRLKARGLAVGVVKHTHHEFDIDHPGKDSYELRHAGAARIAVGSARRYAVIVERPVEHEPTLAEMLEVLGHERLDLILVEGFRHEQFPKIEIHRRESARPLLAATDNSIIAIATDDASVVDLRRQRLNLNDLAEIESFVLDLINAAVSLEHLP
ncbi:MAG: molybdopterin-guanine dinucleotide biosynthesis protein B [Gammaproteobacteria bacterium]|nr:molybdopterin-guanine dinucleotide biosynthesis protein B [Gammaproteobacteria bacterium]